MRIMFITVARDNSSRGPCQNSIACKSSGYIPGTGIFLSNFQAGPFEILDLFLNKFRTF